VELKNRHNDLISIAEDSPYLHLDESSASNKGKSGWCWVAPSKAVTVFKLMNSRDRKALEQFLPE